MKRAMTIVASVAMAGMFGCAQGYSEEGASAEQAAADADATAALKPTQGNTVEGTVALRKVSGGVRIVAHVSGLTPGPHGFHIHEKGDCSAPDASSAGDHFNPKSGSHGDRYDESAHVGDMGNLVADESGHAALEYVDPHMTLEGEASVIGRGVIVHANPDDLQTQPSGNAGPRVACGVIEARKPD
jgi:Cu-Zn family superoxide dismutase